MKKMIPKLPIKRVEASLVPRTLPQPLPRPSWFLLTNSGETRESIALWPGSYDGKTTAAPALWSAVFFKRCSLGGATGKASTNEIHRPPLRARLAPTPPATKRRGGFGKSHRAEAPILAVGPRCAEANRALRARESPRGSAPWRNRSSKRLSESRFLGSKNFKKP